MKNSRIGTSMTNLLFFYRENPHEGRKKLAGTSHVTMKNYRIGTSMANLLFFYRENPHEGRKNWRENPLRKNYRKKPQTRRKIGKIPMCQKKKMNEKYELKGTMMLSSQKKKSLDIIKAQEKRT